MQVSYGTRGSAPDTHHPNTFMSHATSAKVTTGCDVDIHESHLHGHNSFGCEVPTGKPNTEPGAFCRPPRPFGDVDPAGDCPRPGNEGASLIGGLRWGRSARAT